jgi:predicted GIY-YIG superfamily endonuclease
MPGVYFALRHVEEVLYIGRAGNIRQRWYRHHKHQDLVWHDCERIAWHGASKCLLKLLERRLILRYQPLLQIGPQGEHSMAYGYNQKKTNPLVEVPSVSPTPQDEHPIEDVLRVRDIFGNTHDDIEELVIDTPPDPIARFFSILLRAEILTRTQIAYDARLALEEAVGDKHGPAWKDLNREWKECIWALDKMERHHISDAFERFWSLMKAHLHDLCAGKNANGSLNTAAQHSLIEFAAPLALNPRLYGRIERP